MKKWLRIFFLVTCLIGLTSIVRIQAHKRDGVIRTAALQDKSGGDVKNITSHQPEDLQAAMTLKVPAGDTVIALENQEHAQFVREEITDLKPENDITAEIDQEGRLLLNNDQDQAQKVKVVVPVKVADPLMMDELQLELQVVNTNETYGLATLAVKADSDKGSETTTENDNNSNNDNDKPATDNNNSNNNSNSSSKVTSSSKSAAKQKTSQKSQSAKQRSRSTKSKTATTSSSKSASEEAADDDADADAEPATKISRMSQTVDPANQLTGAAIKIQRGQVKIGSWSDDKMVIGGTLRKQEGVEVVPKSSGANGDNVEGFYTDTFFRTHYYVSFQQKANAQSQVMVLGSKSSPQNDPSLDGQTISVYYPNVGVYTDSSNSEKQMGAIAEISNMEYHEYVIDNKDRRQPAYIDFSSNFYSGIIYNGIHKFDLDITFTNEDGTRALDFPKTDGSEYKSYFTFGSLNGNDNNRHEWAGTKSDRKGMLSEPTTVKDHGNGWYEGVGEGVYDKDEDTGEYLPHMGENQWGDFLGSPNYEKGAVSFPLVGVTHEFMLRSDAGFTWQSFSTGSIVPLEPEKPLKTVDRSKKFGIENNDLHGATINRDKDDIDSFNYTVYQKTYSIPDESIAKPNRITLTDTLPDGMSTTLGSIRLYNTDGQVVTDFASDELGIVAPDDRGKVTINGQKVTYELSDKEIEKLDFNGGYFAFQITIQIDDNFVGTFKNKANVRFYSDKDYDWNNDTNEVVTHLNRGLTLRKIGDNRWNPADTERLKDVVFNIEGGNDQRTIGTNEDGEIVLEKMNSKEVYTFTEEVPEGYVSPQKFTVAYKDNRWEITSGSAQVEITNDKNSQLITVKNQVERGDYQFKKIDGTDDTQLAGAEFIIRSKSGKYLTFDSDGKMKGTVETPEEATRLTSSAKETTKVTGLPYGKYKLIEAKAPDGYVVGATHKFTVSKDSGTKVMDIKNDPYSLPITGGRGIIWFIGLGLILTLSALALWRTHPRGG
ncbi:MSCRAMM family protein [Levilactobacillus andaensis]|uniref:MSCRAMM family protein n=1 Tax=Levilactobacillus andaensis TaxID=2799570 RepID=UPI0019433752|nr:SpaA isopeptide-forming pilin-related protein [Levilactobacillus andaensis]